MIDSIVAIVGYRYCDRNHLALDSCQLRRPSHEVRVQLNMMFHRKRIQRVDPDDIVDCHLRSAVTRIQIGNYTFSLSVWDVGDICQR
jgi:hypothetical protein